MILWLARSCRPDLSFAASSFGSSVGKQLSVPVPWMHDGANKAADDDDDEDSTPHAKKPKQQGTFKTLMGGRKFTIDLETDA